MDWTNEIIVGQRLWLRRIAQIDRNIEMPENSAKMQHNGLAPDSLRHKRKGLMTATAPPFDIILPLTLEGSVVRLEPIRRQHADLFWEIAQSDLDDIFRWIPYSMKTADDFHRLVVKALQEQERGESVVFRTVVRRFGRVIGST